MYPIIQLICPIIVPTIGVKFGLLLLDKMVVHNVVQCSNLLDFITILCLTVRMHVVVTDRASHSNVISLSHTDLEALEKLYSPALALEAAPSASKETAVEVEHTTYTQRDPDTALSKEPEPPGATATTAAAFSTAVVSCTSESGAASPKGSQDVRPTQGAPSSLTCTHTRPCPCCYCLPFPLSPFLPLLSPLLLHLSLPCPCPCPCPYSCPVHSFVLLPLLLRMCWPLSNDGLLLHLHRLNLPHSNLHSYWHELIMAPSTGLEPPVAAVHTPRPRDTRLVRIIRNQPTNVHAMGAAQAQTPTTPPPPKEVQNV